MSYAAREIRRPTVSRTLLPAIPTLPVRRFTLAEYHHLVEIGFLAEGDRVELLNGWITSKEGINPPHASALARLDRRMGRLLGDAWVVRQQSPIAIPASDSEPEPDIVVVAGPERCYDIRHPQPKDIALLVEIAETSLEVDRGEKYRIYAAAKVVEYWIVNLVDRRIEVYTRPRGGKNPTYQLSTIYGRGDIVPVVLSGAALGTIAVDEILP